MLTFMSLKLTEMAGKDNQNHTLQKSKSCEISSSIYKYIYIYIYIYILAGVLIIN